MQIFLITSTVFRKNSIRNVILFCILISFRIKAHIRTKERQLGEQNYWRLSPIKKNIKLIEQLRIYATVIFTDAAALIITIIKSTKYLRVIC